MIGAPALRPVEVASGLVFGRVRDRLTTASGPPRAELERAVREALARPPCLVSFSGGRDSSAVLALATHVARREGLEPPIPATNRIPGAPASREDAWQELVVAHLGLQDWVRLEHVDELDAVGPYARRALARHGLLWPFNTHFHLPVVEAAAGGTLLTGIGGDELLSTTRWTRELELLRGRLRPEPRDVLRVGFFVAPAPVRRPFLARRFPLDYGWLTPAARREVVRLWSAQAASEPRRRTAHARWRGRFRYQRVGAASLAVLGSAVGVEVVHPFLDPGFRAAVVSTHWSGRTEAMRLLVGDLLPTEVVERTTKSGFDEAFFAGPSRAFVDAWDGSGIDDEAVDVEGLRREWASERPDPRSFLLLQAVWLASAGDRAEEPVGRLAEAAPVARPAELPTR